MNVTLNLSAGKSLQQKLDAPCKGVVAKALGKYKLEETFGGTVRFESYQAGPGERKQPLADDDPVNRGAILNFTIEMELVLQQQVKHNKMLSILMAPKLTDVVCLFGSRLLNPSKVVSAVSSGNKMATCLASNPALHQAIAAGLSSLSAEETPEEVAAALDAAYFRRNRKFIEPESEVFMQQLISCAHCTCTEAAHININSELEQQMEELRESGALDLLRSKYPVECLIVQNYEVFLQLLQRS
eukprot:gene17706-24064_t